MVIPRVRSARKLAFAVTRSAGRATVVPLFRSPIVSRRGCIAAAGFGRTFGCLLGGQTLRLPGNFALPAPGVSPYNCIDQGFRLLTRVLVIDDSPSVRSLLARRLRARGYEVDEAVDGESGVERALASRPDLVVTDLHMKGISGVHLCRILRSDPSTAHIPVMLLTASGHKRSRFWARTAGAAAYLSKDRLDDLEGLVPTLIASAAPPQVPSDAPAERPPTLQERMSAVLDAALSESVISGEVRALGSAGEPQRLFEGLVTLLAEVISYRWVAILPSRTYEPLFVHMHPADRQLAEAAARTHLGVPAARLAQVVADERASAGGDGPPPEILAIHFAERQVGQLALAPTARGFSRVDQRTIALVATELGGPLQMSALYQDAQRLATIDGLTGLLNRRAFLDVIERERARADRHSFPMSLVLLDIDHFKAVNDRRGHAAGDGVLQGVSKVLTAVARRSDCVARWGGEEFVIALPQTGDAGARVAAERLRRAIAEASHVVPAGEPIRVTASIGVSHAEAPWQIEALVAAADCAMYTAKQRGRNRVESLAAAEMPTEVRRMRAAILADSK